MHSRETLRFFPFKTQAHTYTIGSLTDDYFESEFSLRIIDNKTGSLIREVNLGEFVYAADLLQDGRLAVSLGPIATIFDVTSQVDIDVCALAQRFILMHCMCVHPSGYLFFANNYDDNGTIYFTNPQTGVSHQITCGSRIEDLVSIGETIVIASNQSAMTLSCQSTIMTLSLPSAYFQQLERKESPILPPFNEIASCKADAMMGLAREGKAKYVLAYSNGKFGSFNSKPVEGTIICLSGKDFIRFNVKGLSSMADLAEIALKEICKREKREFNKMALNMASLFRQVPIQTGNRVMLMPNEMVAQIAVMGAPPSLDPQEAEAIALTHYRRPL